MSNPPLSFLLATVCLAIVPASAQTSRCYTLDSLYGSYAVVGSYGADTALAIQAELLDGRGNLTRTGPLNQPLAGSTTGARTVGSVTSNGTYTVNCNGTGTIDRLVTRPDGSTATATDDFLITEATEQDGRLLAATIIDVQRDPSVIIPGGVFLTRVHTRRPNPVTIPCYTAESLSGSYGVVNSYGNSVALGIQAETLDGKGGLNRTGPLNQPVAGSPTGARTVGSVTSNGTYTVGCNGIGVINRLVTRPDGTTATASDDFLITKAVERDGRLLAVAIVDVQRDPSVILPGGVFLTRAHSLRPALLLPAPPAPPTQAKTVAVAGPKNATVTVRTTQLDGSQSTSADGKPLTYTWSIPAGSPSAALLGGTTATPTVQFGQGRGTYSFLLTVTDSAGNAASDLVVISYTGN